MKAMIFAAGLGTRLHPLTRNKPKALVEINGKPMLGHLLRKLTDYDINEFVINVHHFADQIETYLAGSEFSHLNIHISDERDALLDTGGGLIKARELLVDTEPVLIHNVDVLSEIDIPKLIARQKADTSIATLAVSERETSRYLLFDKSLSLCGWQNVKTGELKPSRSNAEVRQKLAFSGVQVLSQDFLDMMQGDGKFSIIDEYLRLSSDYDIRAYVHSSDIWLDLGRPAAIKEAEQRMSGSMD
jgi:NDP-sugar pyrophosphorylase family protein